MALFVGIVLGTLFRFWAYRKWVWRAHPGQPEVPSDGPIPVVPSPDHAGYPETGLASSPEPSRAHGSGGRHAAPGRGAGPLSRQPRDMTMPGAPRSGR